MVNYLIEAAELDVLMKKGYPRAKSIDRARQIGVAYLRNHPNWTYTTVPIRNDKTGALVGIIKRAMNDTGFIWVSGKSKWDLTVKGKIRGKW